jgi:hypothetical protein
MPSLYTLSINNIFSLSGSTALWTLAVFFQFLNLYTVGLLGRVISPSQGRYLHTEETHADIYASSGIRTQKWQCSSPKERDRCDRRSGNYDVEIWGSSARNISARDICPSFSLFSLSLLL